MRKDRFLGRRGREGELINVTPFWAILMANVKDPEPGRRRGRERARAREKHATKKKGRGGGGCAEEERYSLKDCNYTQASV